MAYIKLDLQFFSGEKTEKATPKKRSEARNKGQVAKSIDVNTAVNFFLVFMFLWIAGKMMRDQFINLLQHGLQEYMLWDITEANIHKIFIEYTIHGVQIALPVMLVALIAGVAANFIQIGWLWSSEALKFDLKKIDPIKGMKKFFSIRALVDLLKSLLKISIVGFTAFAILWFKIDEVLLLSQKSIESAFSFVSLLILQMGLAVSILLIVLAIFDYAYQRFEYEKNLRMSKQDIKDEHKNSEGDPKIKSKIREKQRQMAMQRMMQEVPKADVVITNPIHYAVALKYDETKVDAPYVVAKGVDFMALKIKEIAKNHNVEIVENRPLARALYGQVEVGEVIPEEYFKAVAEILAYVYRLKRKI